MSKAQTADDLRAAAKYIEDHGWTQGVAQRRDGTVCALGAIARITGASRDAIYGAIGTPRWLGATEAMMSWLKVTDQDFFGRVDMWNDAPQRTQEDVTAGLEKAAAWAEEQLD